MACALSQGYVLDCRDNAGGAKEFKIIEVENVDAITVVAGVVTAIDNVTAKRWWLYKPARDTLFGKATPTVNVQNGTVFYAQEVSMALNKMQTNLHQELQKVIQNIVYIGLTDANGKHWLYGYVNGMDASGGEVGTGTAMGDRNGYQINFTGQETMLPLEIDDATWATLETPGT